jgi:hypothetical protein
MYRSTPADERAETHVDVSSPSAFWESVHNAFSEVEEAYVYKALDALGLDPEEHDCALEQAAERLWDVVPEQYREGITHDQLVASALARMRELYGDWNPNV